MHAAAGFEVVGSSSTRAKFSPSSSQASRLKASDTGIARLGDVGFQRVGDGVDAGQGRHALRLRDGQRGIEQGHAASDAFLSPQAILTWVSASEIRANDWVSLPVPAVVGTAIIGSISRVALPTPQ